MKSKAGTIVLGVSYYQSIVNNENSVKSKNVKYCFDV